MTQRRTEPGGTPDLGAIEHLDLARPGPPPSRPAAPPPASRLQPVESTTRRSRAASYTRELPNAVP